MIGSIEQPDEAMAARDRISIDVSDIKARIENCRTDPAWRELPLSGKIRALVIEKLEEIEKGKPDK